MVTGIRFVGLYNFTMLIVSSCANIYRSIVFFSSVIISLEPNEGMLVEIYSNRSNCPIMAA